MKVYMCGKVIPLEMAAAGFQLGMSRDLAGHGFERNSNPTTFADVYKNPHTSACFVRFVNSADANAQFNV